MVAKWLALFLVAQCAVNSGEGAKILGLFAMPGKSHFNVFKPLMEGLARKGHEVTVVSFFPTENPIPGYKDISLEGLAPTFTSAFNIEDLSSSLPSWMRSIGTLGMLSQMGLMHCDVVLPSKQIQELLKSKGEFDIAITEVFHTDCFLAVLHKLELPYIGFSSSGMLPFLFGRVASPMDPSLVNNVLIGRTTHMDFSGRIATSIVNFAYITTYEWLFNRPAEALVKKYIGETPPLSALASNISLMFLNQHFSFHQPRPLATNVIEIGGIHLTEVKPLPKDLEDFVKGSKDGVVVFSMGSVLNPSSMSEEKKMAFLNAFRSFPQRFIWKISGDIGELPPNVKTMNWLPQKDLLAHPNVKGFIGHGGLGGMLETITGATPYISIPLFGDQFTNVRTGVEAGVAVELDFNAITQETITKALKKILSKEYQANAKRLAQQFKDRPLSPMDTAIYWTEYIIKYGPNSVRSAAVDLTPIEYYNIDLFLAFSAGVLLVIYAIKKLICKLVRLFKKAPTKKTKTN